MTSNDNIFIGQIEFDKYSVERMPKIITRDGKEYTWNEFGRELMTWEGWQFKLQMIDPNEEID